MGAKFHHEGPGLYKAAFKTYRKWAKPPSAGSSKKKPYQTHLPRGQEHKFERWVRRQNIPFNVHAKKVDYDMRGWFKQHGPTPYKPGTHFSDRYKTPYDTSFSSESKYANKRNPLVWKTANKLVNKRTGRVFYHGR